MSGKRYPEEFKIEAVKQVVDRVHSVSSVTTAITVLFVCSAGFWMFIRADKEKDLRNAGRSPQRYF